MPTKAGNVDLLMRLLRVVIVDDRRLVRKVIQALLTNIAVEQAFEAGDGVSALDAIRTVAPHVVLLDWDMPGMSGAEFFRSVRSPATFPQSLN
jgi:two-component system, chemotaxis family, chemotaxis protein CheY